MAPQQLTLLSDEIAIVTYWRLPRANGQTLACTSYRTLAGLEIRAGIEGEGVVLQASVASHAEAQQTAARWRQQLTVSAAA